MFVDTEPLEEKIVRWYQHRGIFVRKFFEGMKQFQLILLCIGFLSTQSQPKNPEPLIEPLGKKYVLIDRGITGFMYSIDGQWISSPMKIPARLNSRDKEGFKVKDNSLGTDNIKYLYMHRIKYGNNQLYVLYKFYTVGYYKYEATKKGWKEEIRAYYYVLDDEGIQSILNSPKEDVMLKIRIYDSGEIGHTKPSNVQKKALLQIRIKKEYDRQLIFHIDRSQPDGLVRFFFYSQHKVFKDTEGVIKPDFKISGRSLYAQQTLLQYMYYQLEAEELDNFLKLINPKFKDDEEEEHVSNAGQN